MITEFVIDFAKRRKEDDEYDFVFFELQSITCSALYLYNNNEPATHLAEGRQFFNQFFEGASYRVSHQKRSIASRHGQHAPKFVIDLPERHFGESKILQRLYFNIDEQMRRYMPQVAIISREDLDDKQAMRELLNDICSQNFVVKADDFANGSGNLFIDGMGSLEDLLTTLHKCFDYIEDKVSRLPPHRKPLFPSFLIVEKQIVLEPVSWKLHHDTYRAACVLSQDFFNASITTNHQIRKTTADSHKATYTYYFSGPQPLRLEQGDFETTIQVLDDKRDKADRNLGLKKSKPKLYELLKTIAEYVAAFRPEDLATHYDVHSTDLRFQGVSFFSQKTRDAVIAQAKVLANEICPPRPSDAPGVKTKLR